MAIKKIYDPAITLIGMPAFVSPGHIPIRWAEPEAAYDTVSGQGAQLVEFAGRNCYQSWHNPSNRSTKDYIANLLQQGHGSVLEHANFSVLVEGVSRSLTHEWVRHRAGWAYSQLSQRYVESSAIAFVVPPAIVHTDAEAVWEASMAEALEMYGVLCERLFVEYQHILDATERRKVVREAARSVLPNAAETKLVVTANVRAWRHFCALRGAPGTEREIRRLACALTSDFRIWLPEFFHDFSVEGGFVECRYPKV
jgi:thymidylate synthase (FAD)